MIQQMDGVKLSARKREVSGSRQAQQLRKTGWLPCIVYDSSGNTSKIQVQRHVFELFLRNRQGKQNLIIDLDIEGDKIRKVFLKDTQRDHITDHMLHADFLEVSMTRKIKISVPIRLTGESIGVSQQAGVMEQLLRSVEVECLPGDMVNEFILDVTSLSIGDKLCVRDIKVDPKLTILTAPDIAVVSIQLPHIEEEKPAEEAVEAVEGAEAVPAAEGAEGAATAEEAGKGKEKGKETKEKEGEPKEKGKETKEKQAKPAEAKDKGKETKAKAKG